MTNHKEPYAFKIYEKISFRQGEEIDDLYSISIDPEVAVNLESNYIQLRGVLMVSGDYQTIPKKEPLYMVDEEEENVVQQVRELDNGFMTFQYPIPVDITIPSERVRAEDAIEVKVDYFDYELPEPQTLNIQSSIRIEGIVEEEVTETQPDDFEASDFELKEFPTLNLPSENDHPSDYTEAESFDEHTADHEMAEKENTLPNEDTQSSEQKKGRDLLKKNQSQSISEFLGKPEVQTNEEVTSSSQEEEEHTKFDETDAHESSHSEHSQEEEKAKDVTEDDAKKEKMKGLSYLSKFFREDEPASSQVKMRFVQENESLEMIADKYQISSSKLERFNGLGESRSLEAGDVIYVPELEKK